MYIYNSICLSYAILIGVGRGKDRERRERERKKMGIDYCGEKPHTFPCSFQDN